MKSEASHGAPMCPSAQPETDGSVVFGVVGGTVDAPRLIHLAELRQVTPELLAMAAPVNPTEVFRFAAPCQGHACRHFDGTDCGLVTRIVHTLNADADAPPPCRLRPDCRWWQQEGKAACVRCPQIVTEIYHPTESFRRAADPGPL